MKGPMPTPTPMSDEQKKEDWREIEKSAWNVVRNVLDSNLDNEEKMRAMVYHIIDAYKLGNSQSFHQGAQAERERFEDEYFLAEFLAKKHPDLVARMIKLALDEAFRPVVKGFADLKPASHPLKEE